MLHIDVPKFKIIVSNTVKGLNMSRVHMHTNIVKIFVFSCLENNTKFQIDISNYFNRKTVQEKIL